MAIEVADLTTNSGLATTALFPLQQLSSISEDLFLSFLLPSMHMILKEATPIVKNFSSSNLFSPQICAADYAY